jgi:tetraacyldisaccharide 4'-kinase
MNMPRPIATVLWPLSLIYAGGARLRAWLYARGWLKQQRLNAPVISVGNLTVGGTGKTPMVIWLAEQFLADGKRVAILSRGYRGSGDTSDEIELMKSRLQGRALFGVGKDRYAEGRRLEAKGVDVFLLDDGFQHLPLGRDVDIVLVDSTRPFHKQFVLPAGPLREPRSALHRADLVVFTRTDQSKRTLYLIQRFPQFAIYPSVTKLLGFRAYSADGRGEALHGRIPGPVFAFCGIGNPDAFFFDLDRWGVRLAGRRAFADHHRYTVSETQELERAAEAAGAKVLITTEKDAQNIPPNSFSRMPLEIAVISLDMPDAAKFLSDLRAKLPLRDAALLGGARA